MTKKYFSIRFSRELDKKKKGFDLMEDCVSFTEFYRNERKISKQITFFFYLNLSFASFKNIYRSVLDTDVVTYNFQIYSFASIQLIAFRPERHLLAMWWSSGL